MSSFTNKKELKFVITLGNGSFGSSSNNTITLQGFRAIVSIDRGGGAMGGTLRAQIYGVSQSDMNSCVTFPFQPQKLTSGTIKMNAIQVFAIDGAQQTLIFTGNVVNAWGNYKNMPDVFLEIQAQNAYAYQIQPAKPLSFSGTISVATAMKQLADAMNLTFENNGVTTNVPMNQYLGNTALEQAKTLARVSNTWMYIDENSILAICPPFQPRNKKIPLISPQNGLIGYPTFDSVGLNFECLFNPGVIFGGSVEIQSSLQTPSLNFPVNGLWIATNIALRLEAEKPGGAWFMTIRGTKSGLAIGGPK